MSGYRRKRGDSSTRESPRAGIRRRDRPSEGGWGAPSRRVLRRIGDSAQRRQGQRWRRWWGQTGADPPLIQEAWHRIKGWYTAAVNRAPPPARVTIERITAERVALYIYVPPPGENTPIEINPFQVDDSVPEEG